MRIAVIGSGIAGLASAWLLSQAHEVVLFEANDYLGGHTHTHDITLGGRAYAVDTGFIVHNPDHYPLLTRLFQALDVATQPTTMSFSVHNGRSGLEYNATSLDALFCQRRNLVSPRFLGMVRDLFRFYRQAPELLQGEGPGPGLGEWLQANGYGEAFRDDHLVPMASALWSSPPEQILQFPARYLVQFMANHQMLQVSGRPQWRVVRGGSARYVDALRARWQVQERLACPVQAVHRDADGVRVDSAAGSERFDQVVLACHSDQALALLADSSDGERELLGAIPYQKNDTVLHTDSRMLPSLPKARASWNCLLPRTQQGGVVLTYWMNLLQTLNAPVDFCVTLNNPEAVDPNAIIRRLLYHHPVYSAAAFAAQKRRDEISGVNRTSYCGAYWSWGFHEDGVKSALAVCQQFGKGL